MNRPKSMNKQYRYLYGGTKHSPLNALSRYALTARQVKPLNSEPMSDIELIKCVIVGIAIAITTPIIIIALMAL